MSATEATGTGATGCYHLQNVQLAAIHVSQNQIQTQHYTQKPQMTNTGTSAVSQFVTFVRRYTTAT